MNTPASDDQIETAEASPAAVFACTTPKIEILKKRRDFIAASRARRVSMPGFTLQARTRDETPDDPHTIRIGFTCSKKVGNAVARNRAKRRLREIARLTLPTHATPGMDYVLIGRRDTTATREFTQLQADLRRALQKIHSAS